MGAHQHRSQRLQQPARKHLMITYTRQNKKKERGTVIGGTGTLRIRIVREISSDGPYKRGQGMKFPKKSYAKFQYSAIYPNPNLNLNPYPDQP